MKIRCFCLAAASLFPAVIAGAEINPKERDFFEAKIRPVLVERCYECHSAEAEKVKGGLLLDTREGVLRGGDNGAAVVPGDTAKSLLITAIGYHDEDMEMPPKERLSDQVIADFTRWVAMGAPDPREAGDGPGYAITEEIDIEEGRNYWAFQAPVEPSTPKQLKAADWPRTKADALILATLEANGLRPAADAERQTLIRRLYFDLIGLPPSPAQVDAFLADRSPDAVEKVVDELLSSRHYGERWGRYWLDIARYGESSGMERNFSFTTAWRYRDYVIEAFNEDRPYDRFLREQIAGDLMPAETATERNRLLVATGFLAIGPKSLNERDEDQFKMDIVDEQIDVACRAVIGMTVSCARCHDHKFDPISTQDYYAMAGFFTNTKTFYGTPKANGNRQPSSLMPILEEEEDGSNAAGEALAAGQKEIEKLTRRVSEAKREMADFKKTVKDKGKLAAAPKKARQEVETLEKQLRSLKNDSPAVSPENSAMGVTDAGAIEEARLLVRGDVESPGKVVPRAFPAVMRAESDPVIAKDASGRLELAEWLTSKDNPLTARIMVNRIWDHLFGQGLVRTVDNFGTQGEKPSHPELLDHLALKFMAEDWSVKKMVRYLALSRAYQMSSDPDDHNFEIDPDNRLVWRMNARRLDAEALRDAVLAASGQLDLTPAEGSIVQSVGEIDIERDSKALRTVREAESVKRSVYLPIVRNLVPEFLNTFDFAEPSILVGRRNVTTVPTQALYMLNSEFILEQSDKLAERIGGSEPGERDEMIDKLYLLAFSRRPAPEERAAAGRFVDEFLAGFIEEKKSPKEASQAAWASLSQALMASAEFRYLN